MAVTVMEGFKYLVPKLFSVGGVIPEFDYFGKVSAKVVTK